MVVCHSGDQAIRGAVTVGAGVQDSDVVAGGALVVCQIRIRTGVITISAALAASN